MISIRKYLNARRPDPDSALRRALTLLLQLIEIHAVKGDDADYQQFRSGIYEIASRLSDATPPEEILIIVGRVATALKEYGDRTTRYIKAQGLEYQHMVTMLTETIAATTHASDRTIARLTDIEKKLERTSVIEDVRVLRMQLAECLQSIREEIRSQHAEAGARHEHVTFPNSGPEAAAAPMPPPENDPVTDLPGLTVALAELEDSAKREGCWYVVAVVANRLPSINSRFGYGVGDRILRKIVDQVKSGLSADDHLFRWNGPGFIALVLRTASQAEIHKEVGRIIGTHREEVIVIGNRSVLLPISASWAVFPVNTPSRIMREQIDRFITSHAPP
jgi:GGDEF domain-containing protein